jgi:hypothetical protein
LISLDQHRNRITSAEAERGDADSSGSALKSM